MLIKISGAKLRLFSGVTKKKWSFLSSHLPTCSLFFLVLILFFPLFFFERKEKKYYLCIALALFTTRTRV